MAIHEMPPSTGFDDSFEDSKRPFVPYGMPEEIWSDLSDGSALRRAQWFFDRHPNESLYTIKITFGLDDEEITHLK